MAQHEAQHEAHRLWGEDDELVVTREWLDQAPSDGDAPRDPPPPNANAAPARLASPTLTPPLAPTSAPTSAPRFPVSWDRQLTLRQRLLRGGGTVLLVALTLFLLLGGPSATLGAIHRAGDAINARLHPPKPQPTLAEQGFTPIKSPPGFYNVQGGSIAPVMGQVNAAWVCWTTPFAPSATNAPKDSNAPDASSPVWNAHAFYTPNGGARWTALTLPQSNTLSCSISADSERPASALFILSQGNAPDGSCIAPFLYLTNDTGASWTHVPWPLGPSEAACQFQAALEGGAIYVWSSSPLIRGTNPYLPPTGRLLVSRDAGQTWALADNGLDDSNGVEVVGLRPSGRILAYIADVHGSGASAILMSSDDYGASWRSMGEIAGAFPTVFASSDITVTDHGGWGRLYALARVEDSHGSPTVPPQYELATTYIGQPWRTIPLPPLLHGANAALQINDPNVIGVGPAGSLEVERGVVEAANTQLGPSQRLWVWDPSQGEWLLDPQPLPGNLDLQSGSWHAGAQTYWMTTLQLGIPPVLEIYTKTFPADVLTHIQAGGSSAP